MSTAELTDWTNGEPRFVIHRCDHCRSVWYLPRANCPACGSSLHTAEQTAGRGLCVALTRLHVTTEVQDDSLLSLVLVELDEGPLVMGRGDAHAEQVIPGERACASFVHLGEDRVIPMFKREVASQ